MNYRTLGRTGLTVSEIGFGAWGVGGRQWLGGSDEESLAALRRALELGVNLIDTALAYNEGHSEQLVARAACEAGHPVSIATKVPPKNRVWPAQPDSTLDDVFPADYIRECTETSLRHLGRETIDLQQLHVWNPAWTAQEEWRRAFEDLRREGKVRFWGISINDHQPDTALGIIETGLIDTVQVIFNIFDQTPENNLFPACLKHNVGVLARCPLDEGSLTGAITAETEFEPSEFRAMYFRGDRKLQVVERVAALERELAPVPGTLAEKALRFCLHPSAVSTVIPGMRKPRNVDSSCSVSSLGPLPPAVVADLRRHVWNKNFYS